MDPNNSFLIKLTRILYIQGFWKKKKIRWQLQKSIVRHLKDLITIFELALEITKSFLKIFDKAHETG